LVAVGTFPSLVALAENTGGSVSIACTMIIASNGLGITNSSVVFHSDSSTRLAIRNFTGLSFPVVLADALAASALSVSATAALLAA